MKSNIKFAVILVFSIILKPIFTQAQNSQNQKPSHVEIKAVNGDYNFYVNGELFHLKGAGGGGNLAVLHEAGGNSIRT